MPAVSRLGLYGGSRSPYGSFAGKVAGEVPAPEVSTKGGGGRKKRLRYVVEIDGKLIQVANISEVQSVLLQARELAEQSAQQDVKTAVAPKPPKVKVLTVVGKATTSQTIRRDVVATQKVINREYNRAAKRIAIDNEIAQLFRVKFAEEDEEDSILALLLF